jgi:hypothetical protein
MTNQPGTSQRARLTRVEQLTLNTWRWARARLYRVLDPSAVLEQAALHAVLASLRDVDTPLALFACHAAAYPEFSLIVSLLPGERQAALRYEILDTAFLMRWEELTGGGNAGDGLPPLGDGRARSDHVDMRVP